MRKSLLVVFSLAALVAAPAFAQVGVFESQADWDLNDGTKVAGSASFADGTYTLEGNGADIWGTADEGFYLYTERPDTESWQLSAQVTWLEPGTNDWAKLGLMIREDGQDISSPYIFLLNRGAQDLIRAADRPAPGFDSNDGPMLDEAGAEIAASSIYFRVGYWAPSNQVYGEYSLDGTTWVLGMVSELNFDGTVSYGIAITNHENDDALATAEATDVIFEELTAMPAFLDDGAVGEFTNSTNVGAFSLPGSASFDGGVYTVTGGGDDIWDNNDEFYYVYKEMSGAFEITGDIFPLEAADGTWTKGGFMVRNDLSTAAANGFVLLRTDAAMVLQNRNGFGENTGGTDIGLAPFGETNSSYRMVKVGNVVEGFYGDPATGEWVSVGSANIALDDTFLLGLAVTAHDNLGTSTFEIGNLQITEFPYEVVRTLGADSYFPGQTIDVEITVSVREGETVPSLTITEEFPAEAEGVSAISDGGSISGGAIVWNLSNVSGTQTLSYTLVAPTNINIPSISFGAGSAAGAGLDFPIGELQLGSVVVNVAETFSYPDGEDSNGFEGEPLADRNGGIGWSDAWTQVGDTAEPVTLNTSTLDAGLVLSQPTEFNPGNYSAELGGQVGNGLSRTLPVVIAGGDLWVSYTFMEEAGASEVFSGISMYDDSGAEVSFMGKPWNSEFLGIGNLPGGDALTDISYTEPNHVLVRISINGDSSAVYMWVNPDKEDRMDTYDASGDDSITNVAELRIRRGNANVEGTSAFYDNMWISTVAALPPAGAGRVDLMIDDPNRPAEITATAWDVVSVDQVDDAVTGVPGFGHDNGEDHYLIVSGFIYFTDFSGLTGQVVASGLPVDRMSGLNGHILGQYNNAGLQEGFKNAIKFENNPEQSGPFTFEMVPPGNYEELRSAQTVANGDGRLFATLNYEDGSSEETFLNADDWFNDGSEITFANSRLLVDGMNRLSGDGSFDARFDPAVFECFIPVDPTKVLVSITLEFDATGEVSSTGAAYNLFDIWALPAGGTSVNDWALY